jgi:hypothetical protein
MSAAAVSLPLYRQIADRNTLSIQRRALKVAARSRPATASKPASPATANIVLEIAAPLAYIQVRFS